MPTPITPSDVLKQLPQPVTPSEQPPPEAVPTEPPAPKPLIATKARAIKNVEPFSFSVPTRTDVGDREEVMQRKASAMNQITGRDVEEFLEKLAADDQRWEVNYTKKIPNKPTKTYTPGSQESRGAGIGPHGVIQETYVPGKHKGKQFFPPVHTEVAY